MTNTRKNQTNKKLRIAVLMGGPSAEHEVSLRTGRMILENLDKQKYFAKGIKISKKAEWPISPAEIKKGFDLVFIAMHGEYGEDGTVQKILDKYKIRYTGSGAKASALGMDKAKSSAVFKKAGLKAPDFSLIHVGPKFNFKLEIGYPAVVKPNDRGSSVGISIVESFSGLLPAIKKASEYSRDIMIQKYIKGREFTCGVLEFNGKPKPFLPTEIIPRSSRFFDYDAKYTSGASREITPPRLPNSQIRKIQEIAVKAHKAIGARGFSRTDMIMESRSQSDRGSSIESGQSNAQHRTSNIYVLEINTIPGMTETSLLPQAAKAGGISFPKLLDLIIESASN